MIGYHEAFEEGRIADVWLHTTRLAGESLWGVLLRSSVDRSRHFRTLGTLLRELHSPSPPDAFRNQAPWIDRNARTNLRRCDGSAELLADLDATRPVPWPEVLIHANLALDNVLFENDGSMSLIDWPRGDLGDPRYDIALALGTEPELHLHDADIAAFFEGYGRPRIDPANIRWFLNLYEFF